MLTNIGIVLSLLSAQKAIWTMLTDDRAERIMTRAVSLYECYYINNISVVSGCCELNCFNVSVTLFMLTLLAYRIA